MEWSEEMYATEPVLEKIEELENQLKEAREKNLRIIRGEFIQICSHCNFETKIGGWDELQKHIQECKGHPVYKLTEKLKEAQAHIKFLTERLDERPDREDR